MDQQTIHSLITKSLNNDTTAFRKLVEAHQQFVYRVAFRLVCNEFDTEEVVQETFIRVWKNLHRYNIDLRFTTWLYKIVINLCYDKIKSAKRFQNKMHFNLDNASVLNQASIESMESSIINQELGQIIRYLTNELTPKQKLVFTLSELEELTTEEIASFTGLTPGKIKSNLYCARQCIKEKLIIIEERRGRYEK
jgi:RNA polymerase sigma-70 factor (ECF subfamily)